MRAVPAVSSSSPAGRVRAPARDAGDRHGLHAAAELLRALANPHRLAIVLELARGPRCVHELVDALGISQPLASQHLRVLKAIHLVRPERRGREIAYSLGDEHVSHIVHDAIVHAKEMTS
jgi:DNA-binding transcriptional ArsR family regulator